MKNISKYFNLITSALVFISFMFLLFPCIEDGVVIDGIEMIFGYSVKNKAFLTFNVIGFIFLLLILFCIIFPLCYNEKNRKWAIILETFAILVVSVLYFLLPLTIKNQFVDIISYNTMPCLYVGASLSIVSFLFSCFVWLVNVKKV